MMAVVFEALGQIFCLHRFHDECPGTAEVQWGGVIKRVRCAKCQLTRMVYKQEWST